MKYKVMSLLFALLIIGGFVLHLAVPDKAISYEERRSLVQFPKPSVSTVFDGSWMKNFDKYAADQFVGRKYFRGLKNGTELFVFGKQDVHDIYLKDGALYANAKPSDKGVRQFAAKLASLTAEMPETMSVYYSIIPDKSTLIDAKNHPVYDTEAVYEALHSAFEEVGQLSGTPLENGGVKAIYLEDLLQCEDFYKTDIHWRQEKLWPVVSHMAQAMGFAKEADVNALEKNLATKQYAPFYGAYYGQFALPIKADTLNYLVGSYLEAVTVTDLATGKTLPLYSEDRLGGVDSYDVFVGGALPCVALENPKSTSDKELIIFRDSYGSAIAPLLAPFYRKITMIDLRYMPSSMIGDFVIYDNQQVLFLYSAMLANQVGVLK